MAIYSADFVIIGGGLYGSSIAYHLAQRGATNIVVLEKSDICAGGTAKSCAIVRTHYSIEANLTHAVESLNIFANFDDAVGGDCGWRETGYLVVGPAAHREPMLAVFEKQNARGIDTRVLSPAEARELHPLLYLDDAGVIGFDSQSGYADPNLTTHAYARRAKELGVTFYTDTPATHLGLNGGLKTIETPRGKFETPTLILALGPWTNRLAHTIGLKFDYVNSRHKVITLKIDQPYQPTWPIVKDLTTPDKIYFRPETGGLVLVGTGDHGDPLDDPDTLTDHVDLAHVSRIDALISHRMPAFADAEFTAGWTGPYDITPDWNPLLGPVPGYDGLFVAVGFSGHGFKLAPTLSEGLAQTVLGQPARIPIDMYRPDRLAAGHLLHGAYGIGSIS